MSVAKRKYIEAAYELLSQEGLDGVSIRKVADRVGCSSTALYRHFPVIDKLTAVASIRFLRDYIKDARILSQVDYNPLELNLQLWECLAYYSFRDADIYENLFFGDPSGVLYAEAVQEYFEQYPEDVSGLRDFMYTMITQAPIEDRDLILLSRAAEEGMLSQDSADYLCKLDTYLYRGMLATLKGREYDEAGFREATHEFMQLIIRNYMTQLEEGYSILVVSADFVEEGAKYEKDARASFRVELEAIPGDRSPGERMKASA